MFGVRKESTADLFLAKYDFNVTKRIFLGMSSSMFMDDEHKKFAFVTGKDAFTIGGTQDVKIFDYSVLTRCEILEDGSTDSKGSSGSALIGGALLGTIGAIAGASRGKGSIGYCNSLYVMIGLNDPDLHNIRVDLIKSKEKTDSSSYRQSKDLAQSIKSDVDYMIDYSHKNGSPKDSSPADPADEIMKYKKLLDAGAITQEEFDAKKKQLLNL